MGNPPRYLEGDTDVTAPQRSPAGMPLWVKASIIIIGALVLLLVVLQLAGIGPEHGPGLHAPEDGAPPGITKHGPGEGAHG